MVSHAIAEADLFRVAQDLPTAPRLLVELGQLIRHPRVDAREITTLLRQDPAMVARLIRMANSAAYARVEPAASIEEAVASVGFSEVHRLVGAVAAQQMADQPLESYGVDGAQMRRNALFVAVIMEELGGASGEDPRSCYTVGLLRSIGKMALQRLAPEGGAVAFSASGHAELDRWEESVWGVNNGEVAERILLHWRLPHDTVVSIRHHYRPERRHNPIIHLLNLAAGSAEHRCFGLPGEESFWRFTPDNFAKAGVDARQFQTLTERAQRVYQRLHQAVA
jgi:HD-like signal output (HDOD) protein